MNLFSWTWTHFTALTWWQMILWVAYTVYFIYRSAHIWNETHYYGVKKGYKHVFFGRNPKYFRLYHLIRMILDVPPSIIGLFFPVLRWAFSLKLYEFKQAENTIK